MNLITKALKPALLFLILSVGIFSFVQRQEDTERGSHELDAKTQKEVFGTLDAFMKAFNAQDRQAVEASCHFPHFRLASGKMSKLDSAGIGKDTVKVSSGLKKLGWHHSAWIHRNVIQASPEKVHVDTRYARYREDGSLIAYYESLYILTKENGRWGIKFRSSYAD